MSATTENLRFAFEIFVENNFNEEDIKRILEGAVDWDKWINQPGLPPVPFDFTTTKSNESISLADGYIALIGRDHPANWENFKDPKQYYSNLKVVFLERLKERVLKVTPAIMALIDTDYKLSETMDPEIKQRWFPLGIYVKYDPVIEKAHEFVSVQGRGKYLYPIY